MDLLAAYDPYIHLQFVGGAFAGAVRCHHAADA